MRGALLCTSHQPPLWGGSGRWLPPGGSSGGFPGGSPHRCLLPGGPPRRAPGGSGGSLEGLHRASHAACKGGATLKLAVCVAWQVVKWRQLAIVWDQPCGSPSQHQWLELKLRGPSISSSSRYSEACVRPARSGQHWPWHSPVSGFRTQQGQQEWHGECSQSPVGKACWDNRGCVSTPCAGHQQQCILLAQAAEQVLSSMLVTAELQLHMCMHVPALQRFS